MNEKPREPSESISGKKNEISFIYPRADHFRYIYANGVWGGTNPHGEILMNFFMERHEPPHKTDHKIKEDGSLVQLSRDPESDVFIRELQVGIILPLNVAKSIRDWLDDKINTLEKALAESVIRKT